MGKSKEYDQIRDVEIANSDENKLKYPSNYISTTKYNALTFFPLSLLNQFKRYANVYFLLSAVLNSIPAISPLNPASSIAPLIFVVALSMVREAYEDLTRHKSDIELNSSKTVKYIHGSWTEVDWKDVYVGDIIKIKDKEFFPADLLLLASSDKTGSAFIQTSSLDGEKNLKPRLSIKKTQDLMSQGDTVRLTGRFTASKPDSDLYKADGT